MKIDSLKQAEEILHSYIPAVKRTGDDQSLVRMWPLLAAVGNPQNKLKVVHVAGTSGKTSTSYFIAELLRVSGKKVGLTVSPHVDSITERVQVDGQPLTDEVFCSELHEFLSLIDGLGEPSYFEILIVFVLWEFVRCDVDYVVLETGMGGLYDGTNVVTRQDKVCVITDIGYDHMHVLGNDIASIARQKAGIIHDGNLAFSGKQEPEAMQQLRNRATQKNATLHIVDRASSEKNLQVALFQEKNWALAQSVAAYISERDGFELAQLDPADVMVPGRMEIQELPDGSSLIMDGAHNGQKMEAFVESFQAKYPGEKAVVMIALKQGKELPEVIDALRPITEKLIVTTFTAYQDLPFKAQDPETVAAFAREKLLDAVAISDHVQAHTELLKSSGTKIITGSFYLLGQVRKYL